MEKRGRTDDKKKYLAALKSFNHDKIKFTRWYRFLVKPGILSFLIKYIGFGVAAYGLYQFINEWEWSFWSQIFPMLAGLGWELFIFFGLKENWDLMTINGKVVHPVFTASNSEFKAMLEKSKVTSSNSTSKQSPGSPTKET